jgi:SAM-dependent methyltransferase
VAEGLSLPFPPLHLLHRTGHMDGDDPVGAYDRMGHGLRALIESMLPDAWTWEGRRVLDFGCGAGRVLRHFADLAEDAEFWGCDIDEPSILWMHEHMSPPFHVFNSSEEPGLPQEDGYFDLIYAISVYTHITEHWAGWLLEHHRVLADGGLMFATFLGEGMIQPLLQEEWDEDRIGMNTLLHGNPWDEGGPITFHSPWWLRAHWGRAFDIVELRPFTGLDDHTGHGLVLLRRKPVHLTTEDLTRFEPDEPREILALQHHTEQLSRETLQLRASLAETRLQQHGPGGLAPLGTVGREPAAAPTAPEPDRPGSSNPSPMHRDEKILIAIDRSMRLIEIGPLAGPIAPKADGWLTSVVDHASREELVGKYRDDPNVDTSQIEEVDIVWKGGSLDDAVPVELHGTFDACIASHVFEHIPDPIGLLLSLERILQPAGVVSLIIPDKRFCFDFFRPLSSVGELLEAHDRRASRHTRGARFDHEAYSVRSEGEHAWSRRPVTDVGFFVPLAHAKHAFDSYRARDTDPYVDVHGWQFTPSSFELAVTELSALGVVDFSIAHTFPTDGCEFYATLRRGRAVPASEQELNARRLELLGTMLEELADQAQLLGRGASPATRSSSRLLAAHSARAAARRLRHFARRAGRALRTKQRALRGS